MSRIAVIHSLWVFMSLGVAIAAPPAQSLPVLPESKAHLLTVQDHNILISKTPTAGKNDRVLREAFDNRRSNVQVQGGGTVARILPDDRDGSPHQRFILRLNSGQTILIAHNIALAPRIPELQVGDRVDFYGEYEWNAQGGVIHWTHDDPQGRHVAGWLKHKGRLYQ